MFRKAIIIGVGQIGASIGMNLIARRLVREVIGVGRHPDHLREAVRRRAIHRGIRSGQRAFATLAKELGAKDLVILATPVRAIRDLLKKMPQWPLVIDVGSTKATIVAEASRRKVRFVGCHPIAGTEIPGVAGAAMNLFRGKFCVVATSKQARSTDLAKVRALWRQLGARVVSMGPAAHDRLLAFFSHLPHLIAFSLVTRAPLVSVPRGLFVGLGSFRSATRVAGSSPEMWRDILLENRVEVLKASDRYLRELKTLRGLVAKGKAPPLLGYLSAARRRRLKIY